MKLKDKAGNELTREQYLERWKKGMQAVTPLQMAKTNMYGYYLILIGVLIGIVSSIINKTWWLVIVLCGSFIVSSMATLGNYQKIVALVKLDNLMKDNELEKEDKI